MNRTWRHLAVSAGLLAASMAMAHSTAAPAKVGPRPESVTMNGEIIDPQCYFTHASRGAAHASCAAMCAKGGQGLSFLDDATGKLYPLIAKAHGASQNEGLLPHLGKSVRVSGTVYRSGSNAALLIKSVAVVAAKPK